MKTTHASGKARRPQAMLTVVALALGAILLAPTAPVAHAAPGDGPGSDPTIKPSQPHASENPVYLAPGQTEKEITITWSPPGARLTGTSQKDGDPYGPYPWPSIGPEHPSVDCDAQQCTSKGLTPFGWTLTFWAEFPSGERGLPLTVTTRRLDVPPPRDVIIPDLPGLRGPGPRLPWVVQPSPR